MRRACLTLCCVFLLAAAAPALADDLSGLLPEAVDGLERVQLVTGAEAQRQVDRLHGKALQAEASAIARYASGGGRPAEVWVSRVASEKEARRQTGLMVHKMFENPKSPFSNPARLDHGGRAVYRFDGMGQVHLIWHSGDLVWWVSAAPDRVQPFLDAPLPLRFDSDSPRPHLGATVNTDDPDRKSLGSPVLFRLGAALGYNLTEKVNVSLQYEHMSNAYLANENEGMDNLGLRLGYRF